MSRESITPVWGVILGILARSGPSTSYEIKQSVARSVANFWQFQHSQLYSEPAKLAAQGLVKEKREEGGRRRRVYTITDAGRKALKSWLAEPAGELPQFKSLAVLKLFFGHFGRPEDMVAMAKTQEAAHRKRLERSAEIEEQLRKLEHREYQLMVLKNAQEFDRTQAETWRRTARHLS